MSSLTRRRILNLDDDDDDGGDECKCWPVDAECTQ